MTAAEALSTLDWLVVLALDVIPMLGALILIELERAWNARRRRRERRPGYVDLTARRRPW